MVKDVYSKNSTVIKNLFTVLCEFDDEEKKLFLMFTTSKTRLPFGGLGSSYLGLANLNPPLTVSSYFPRYTNMPQEMQNLYLPTGATCFHELKLPNYSTIDVLKSKVLLAIKEGQGMFLLT